MGTSPKVTFGLYNLEIKSDSTPAASNLQPFSKILDLKTDNIQPMPYATYEPNFWLLDGKFKFLPTTFATVHVGLMSLNQSNSSGIFTSEPVLTVTFDIPHTSDGLILRFSQYTNDYANSITVAYYDANNSLILSNNYAPDSWEYEIDLIVTNFQKIIITFHSTNKPYRYLRVTGIDYGQLISFTGTAIKAASVVEEINILSTEISINTCNLNLFSTDAEFSIINPSGYYSRLSQRQPLSIYEIVDGNQIYMGQYYLDTWKNTSDTLIEFSCVDAIGILDRIPFRGGMWLPDGILSQNIIDQIFQTAGLPYDLDTGLYDIPVIGWIPQCSCREALQHVAFAIGAYIDCSRSNQVKIYKSIIANDETDSIPITKTQKGTEQSVELKTLVTGVEITAHNYTEGTESINLYEGILTAGEYEISFNQAAHSLSISGATIVEKGDNYAIINVFVPGQVALTGLNFVDNQQVFSAYDTTVGSTVLKNVLKITDATLISNVNGATVVDRMYNYYLQRYQQNVKLYASTLQTGQVVLVDTLYSGKIKGVIEKMNINLSDGFTSQFEITGVVNVD